MRYCPSNNLPATYPPSLIRPQRNNLLQGQTMFRSIVIILTLAVMAIATKNPNYCYEDGCKRTLQNQAGGFAQCKVDLSCKVTPAAVVVTSTKKVYSGTGTITVSKSTNIPSPVNAVSTCNTGFPQYLAKSCEYVAASYTSACSCISATGSTSFAPAPTVTATVIKAIPTAFVYV